MPRREAKADADQTRDALEKQVPWSKQVELYRQQCRNAHLTLFFAHPLSPHSQSMDPLWLHTTYILIQAYRDSIARLEASPTEAQAQSVGSGRRPRSSGPAKKVVTRFRQALASEETFYRSLIARIVRFYDLTTLPNVVPVLKSVKLLSALQHDGSDRDGQFKATPQEKKTKLSLVYKALICLGDLERYKEQYKPQQNGRREGEGGKFEVAERYYFGAWSLNPDDGSAWNQLAVISTYIPNDFSTTYYYFRALAVRNAFKGADVILAKFFGKAFDRWRAEKREKASFSQANDAREVEDGIDRWKEDVVVMVGIVYLKAGFTYIPKLLPSVLESLRSHLQIRRLQTESIVHLTSIVIGSHFRARSTAGLVESGQLKLIERSYEAEGKAAELVLQVARVYLSVALEEVKEARASVDNGLSMLQVSHLASDGNVIETSDMPLLISAVLRRILPSLRIFSKWLKLNKSYLTNLATPPATATAANSTINAYLTEIIASFWQDYENFIKCVEQTFPLEKLPSLCEPLEEDIDMRGFSPLQKGITPLPDAFVPGIALAVHPFQSEFEDRVETLEENCLESAGLNREKEVHPNEEHLMRLSDLQMDGKLVLGLKDQLNLLDVLSKPKFSMNPPKLKTSEKEHDVSSVSTLTEDDPVNLAMRATLGTDSVNEEVEDEEEVIVWNRRKPEVLPIGQQVSRVFHDQEGHDPSFNASSQSLSRTPNDLLKDLVGGSSSSVSHLTLNQNAQHVACPIPEQSDSPSAFELGKHLTNQQSSSVYPPVGSSIGTSMAMPDASSPYSPLLSNQATNFPTGHSTRAQTQNQAQVQSLFLGSIGSQRGSIWTMTREESQKGKTRTGIGGSVGAGMGMMGWVGSDEPVDAPTAEPRPGALSSLPPPAPHSLAQALGPSVPNIEPPPGFGLASASQQSFLPLALKVQNQQIGHSTSASATLQAQATYRTPTSGMSPIRRSFSQPHSRSQSQSRLQPQQQPPTHSLIQTPHLGLGARPSRQPQPPSSTSTWDISNMHSPPVTAKNDSITYHMRPALLEPATSKGSSLLGFADSNLPGVGVSGGGIWETGSGLGKVGKGQGWVSGL
ncbi:hypothetical protein L204_101141 [Cryptococcus depauperatus]